LRKNPRLDVEATIHDGGGSFLAAVHLKGSATFEGIDAQPGNISNPKSYVETQRKAFKRPSFTIDFAEYDQKQRFHGLRKIHLNNSRHDPSLLCEFIGGELFRSVNVPAARTAHARVFLNDRSLGVYVLKEGFEEEFLAQHFSRTDGKIYEGSEFGRFLMVLRKLGVRPIEEQGDRWQRLKHSIDVERFASMFAMELLVCHFDGYGVGGNNYRFYDDPETGRFVLMVHGMDLLFTNKAIPLTPAQLDNINDPDRRGILANVFWSTLEGRELYAKRLPEIFANHLHLEPLTNRVLELAKPIRAEIECVEGRDAANKYDGEVDQLVQRIANRRHEVDRQLNPK
jgi:spore coat protein H